MTGSRRPSEVGFKVSISQFRSSQLEGVYLTIDLALRTSSRIEYEHRIKDVVTEVISDLERRWSLEEIAQLAGFSQYHFHRMFNALLGESAMEMIRRLKLEKAAYNLLGSNEAVVDIALVAGYTHEAFTRAFKAAYRVTPSEFRAMQSPDCRLARMNGVHFPFSGEIIFAGETNMNATIKTYAAGRYLAVRHLGPYHEIGATFAKAFELAIGNGLYPTGAAKAFYYDDPSITPPSELRADASIPVSDDSEKLIEGAHYLDVPELECLVVLHKGSYRGLGDAWLGAYQSALPGSNRIPADHPPFESYLNDCSKVPEEELLTEICIPLAPR